MTNDAATPMNWLRLACLLLAVCVQMLGGCAIGPGSMPPISNDISGEAFRQAGEFVVAPENTIAGFEVAVVDLIAVKGEFKKVNGRLVLGAEGTPALVDIDIDAASAETGLEDLNQVLRGLGNL